MRAPLRLLLPLLVLATACTDRANVTPPVTEPEPTPEPKILGVYDFTVDNLGAGEMSISAARVVEGEAVPLGSASGALGVVGNGLQIEGSSWGRFNDNVRGTGNGQRYIWITFRIRNGTGAPLNNVTFIPVSANNTISGTPFLNVSKLDESPAAPAAASSMVPTGQAMLGADLRMSSPVQDVLQVFTEAEVEAISKPSGVISYFPYGFVVRNVNVPNSRLLPVIADNHQWDGVVTIAFRVPFMETDAEDVRGFTVRTVAVQDTETRLTESIEESTDTAAVRRLRARATAMGATTVTVLAGSPASGPSVPNYPGQRQICEVRTAGEPGNPVTLITNPGAHSDFMILREGEEGHPCAAGFRTGTPARPATNVPFEVRVRAVDRYGNRNQSVRDSVRFVLDAASPAHTTSPTVRLGSGGGAFMQLTYSDYGNSIVSIRGNRIHGTANPLQIAGVTRVWTAGAGTTSWHTGGNWLNGAVPMHLDSVFIPAAAPLFPQLASNVTVRGVTVENGATISLGAFDLTAGANVATGTSGGINSSVGRVILTGTAATVRGNLPRMRVLGTYSLDGNVTAVAPTRVEAGRLRSGSFRMRTASQ